MDYTPVKFLIKAFEAHYPESLGVCLVHKAPWVFQGTAHDGLINSGIWNIIKGWLDPVVASKIHFTRSTADLEKFIPKSQIIKELDGDEQYEYQYVEPVPGENDIMNDTDGRDKIMELRDDLVQRFEETTKRWIAGDDVVAERTAIARDLNENYWKLDPYVRARTLYDRMGAIGEKGGFVYPNTETTEALEKVDGSEENV
jgi:CRAL/TRIO domain